MLHVARSFNVNKYKLNWTVKSISDEMNINKNTVHMWIKRYKEGISLDRKKGSGIKIEDKNI